MEQIGVATGERDWTMPTGSPQDPLRPLREHRAFIWVFVVSAMLSALVLTYVYNDRYRAEATFFFKSSDVTRLQAHNVRAFGSPFPYTEFKSVTQTVNSLVESDALLRRVVTELHLDAKEPRDYSGPWYVRYYKQIKDIVSDYADDAWMILKWGRLIEEDRVDTKIRKLRKLIKIRNNDSYLFSLQVSWDTPESAIAIANRLGAGLVETLHREDLSASKRQIDELAALRAEKAREIQVYEANLRELLATNQVASIADELKTVTDRSSKLQQGRAESLADLRQSDAKIASSAEKLRVAAPAIGAQSDDAPMGRRVSRVSPDDYGKFTSKKLDAEVESSGLRARLASIEQSYRELMPRIDRLTDVQAHSDLMTTQLEAEKRAYQALTEAYEETVIRATTGQSELRLQAKPEVPPGPVSPIKVYHVGLAGALAALIAAGIAYVLDFFGIGLFLPPAGRRSRRRMEAPLAPALAPETAAMRASAD